MTSKLPPNGTARAQGKYAPALATCDRARRGAADAALWGRGGEPTATTCTSGPTDRTTPASCAPAHACAASSEGEVKTNTRDGMDVATEATAAGCAISVRPAEASESSAVVRCVAVLARVKHPTWQAGAGGGGGGAGEGYAAAAAQKTVASASASRAVTPARVEERRAICV